MNASLQRRRLQILTLSFSVFVSGLLGYMTHPLSSLEKTTSKTKDSKSNTRQIAMHSTQATVIKDGPSPILGAALTGRSVSMLSLIRAAANRRQQKHLSGSRAARKRGHVTTVHPAPVKGTLSTTHVATHQSTSVRGAKKPTASHPAVSQGGQSTRQTQSLYWLAHAIQAEAGGESWQTQVAVGDVIMNRVHSSKYPNTVKTVIFQVAYGHYAFSSVPNGWIYKTPSQTALAAAKAVLVNHKNILPTALVFYNSAQTSASNWVRSQPIIRVIGHMTFAR